MGRFGHAVYWVDAADEELTRMLYAPYAAEQAGQGTITLGRYAALNIADLVRDDPDAAVRYLSHLHDAILGLMAAVPKIHQTERRRIVIHDGDADG